MEGKEIKPDREQETNENETPQSEQSTENEQEETEQTSAEEEAPKPEEPQEPTTEEQLAQMKDRYLRLMAEYDNYRKRTLKEKTELILSGGQSTVKAILPVLDDFERAIATESDDVDAVKKGMELIFNKFNKVLESLGVKKIEAVGADFDTDLHEAVAMIPAPKDEQKGKVIDCIQTGYTLNDKVIRCAKVAVGQ